MMTTTITTGSPLFATSFYGALIIPDDNDQRPISLSRETDDFLGTQSERDYGSSKQRSPTQCTRCTQFPIHLIAEYGIVNNKLDFPSYFRVVDVV